MGRKFYIDYENDTTSEAVHKIDSEIDNIYSEINTATTLNASETPPVSAQLYTIWYNTSNGKLYVNRDNVWESLVKFDVDNNTEQLQLSINYDDQQRKFVLTSSLLQDHGSGLNADKLDGRHYSDIMNDVENKHIKLSDTRDLQLSKNNETIVYAGDGIYHNSFSERYLNLNSTKGIVFDVPSFDKVWVRVNGEYHTVATREYVQDRITEVNATIDNFRADFDNFVNDEIKSYNIIRVYKNVVYQKLVQEDKYKIVDKYYNNYQYIITFYNKYGVPYIEFINRHLLSSIKIRRIAKLPVEFHTPPFLLFGYVRTQVFVHSTGVYYKITINSPKNDISLWFDNAIALLPHGTDIGVAIPNDATLVGDYRDTYVETPQLYPNEPYEGELSDYDCQPNGMIDNAMYMYFELNSGKYNYAYRYWKYNQDLGIYEYDFHGMRCDDDKPNIYNTIDLYGKLTQANRFTNFETDNTKLTMDFDGVMHYSSDRNKLYRLRKLLPVGVFK